MKTVSEIIKALAGGGIKVKAERRFALSRNFCGRHWYMQGGCSDGTFAYYAMNSGGDSRESITRIYKIDIASWKTVGISEDMYISHSNDMAYDVYNRRLVVSWCDIEPDKIGIVDPDTLRFRETKTIPQRHFSIAYSPEKHLYVAGKSRTYDLVLLNDSFEPQRLLTGTEGYVKQGLECDGQLIYFLHSSKTDNRIYVYEWDGTLVCEITVPIAAEGENLFIHGDKLVCAFNDRENDEAVVYELSFFSEQE